MAVNFKDVFNQLKNSIIDLAKKNFKDLAVEAASDGTSLLHTIEKDLQRHIQQLAEGKITKGEFKLLLLAKEDLVQMSALTEAGLAAAKADAFKTAVFNTIIDTVLATI